MKAKNRQASSDPLPYVQVDRAVKPKAGQLAGVLNVSRQHALGSLVEFWELCGDPRDLERLVQSGQPEVVLSSEEIRRRFRLASGFEVDPADLVVLGLLEPRPEGFRVQGMSRYFAPIERRLIHRAQSVAGGKARSAAGRGANGRFAGAGAPAGGRVAARLDAHQPAHQPTTSREPADHQPDHQPPTSTADSGQRATPALLLPKEGEARRKTPRRKPDASDADPRHQPLIDGLCRIFAEVRGAKLPFTPRDAVGVKALLLTGTDPVIILEAWRRALNSKRFPVVSTPGELHQHLAHFIGARGDQAFDPNQGILSNRNVNEREDLDLREVVRLSQPLGTEAIKLLKQCRWARGDGGFMGAHKDPFTARYLNDTHGAELAALGITIAQPPKEALAGSGPIVAKELELSS